MLKFGNTVSLSFLNENDASAKISYVSKQDDGKVLIVFKLTTWVEDILQYRKISFNITWWSYSGLKVPNSSIIDGEDGLKYVVIEKSGIRQNALVKVLKKNDKYSIITTYDTEELNALGVNMDSYTKVSKYDSILVYPE